jgi:ribonuclease HI
MGWRSTRFKGKEVWVEVDADGMPLAQGGRVNTRYSQAAGARIYRAGAAGVDLPTGPVLDLPEGVSADEAPAKAAPGAGGKTRPGSGFGSAGSRTAGQAALAAEAARALVAALPAGTVRAWTDGACKGNPGPAGAGAVVELPDGRVCEVARALGVATNNVGELSAVGLALDVLDEAGLPPEAPCALFSDSSYADGVLTRGWKAKANVELITGLRARLKARPGVRVHWIAGHVGIAGNERADQLANEGVAGRSRVTWR